MQSRTALRKTISAGTWIMFMLSMCFFIPTRLFAQDFTATSLADYGNVSVMEVTGGYDAKNPDGTVNSGPRKTIASEFFRTHKDEYDFLVIFSNFDFPMPEDGHAKAFYLGVKNDTQNIGINAFNYAQDFGSGGRLQGMVDMGNLSGLATDPMDPKFNETLYLLSHELMHRWGAHAKFRNADGSDSTTLLGKDLDHWSFLLDSGGSLLYGNRWQDNGNGTFTSLVPQNEMKIYSPLDLYLMGMIEKSKVPPMLLIDNPGIDPGRLPEAGVTISGTARTVTIDDIIAAMGQRAPDAATSQKSFKTAFIYITQPGTFASDAIYQIENMRNGFVTRHSILTDGQSIVEVASMPKEDVPTNPGVLPPSTTPRTLPADINEGVQWLQANQKSDGSWADLPETEERDTAQAVLALRSFPVAEANYGSGLLRLGLSTSGNTDFLCRKIEAYAAATQDTADLLTELLARRNSDGGWGSDRMYQSNPADTALALKALALAGGGDQSVIASAISYLTARQNSDGGWGPDDNSSTLQFTAAVLSAFNKYRGSYQLEDRISRGMELIASRQNMDTDKGFGNSPSTVYDTVTAVLVLRELGASTDITNNGLDYIRGKQGGDGSWNGSSFQTAMAIDAVYKATVDPDLSIKTADISFIPATITSLPANIVINANIWNLGQTAVSQATVALYKDSVTEANRIDEQIVAVPGQSFSAVTFSTSLPTGSEYRFFIVADPANLVKESSKANNSAAAAIAVEATYDLEILPSDISLSTNTANMYQDVKITAMISNKGTMNAYNAHVKYFINESGIPFEIATQTVDVPAGTSITKEITWRANKAGENMQLVVQVDPYNNELSETNNKATTTITVRTDTRPNLAVSYKDIVITPSPGNERGTVTISALVKNDGFSPANNIAVRFYRDVPCSNTELAVTTGNFCAQALQIGTQQTIATLGPGENSSVSVDWVNIPESGQKLIYVEAYAETAISEILDNDNYTFVDTLTLRTLPDLAISTNSIVFSPGAPKEGDQVAIIVTVQNQGEQTALEVVVRLSEGSVALGNDQTIPSLVGGGTATVLFFYDPAAKGAHTFNAVVDPYNEKPEQSKDNNSASRTLGVQDSSLWVTEQYISPNGDEVKDSTQLFFSFDTSRTITVSVVNNKGETVRTFNGPELAATTAGAITWDGFNDIGTVVADGTYQMQLRDAAAVIGSLGVTVDTNRSPLSDAFGTKYLLNNNLTCMLPDIWWKWFPDESGIVFDIPYPAQSTPEYPAGLYTMAPDGQDILMISPPAWSENIISPDSSKVAFIINQSIPSRNQLWVMDRDGNNKISIVSYDPSQASVLDFTWSPNSDYLVYRLDNAGTTEQLKIVRSDGAVDSDKEIDSGGYFDFNYLKWSTDGSQVAYIFGSYDASSNYTQQIRINDLSGNTRDVFAGNSDVAENLEWFGDQKLMFQELNCSNYCQSSFWIVDTSGNGKHVKIFDLPYGSFEMSLSPDKKSMLFLEYYEENIRVKLSDNMGNVTIVYEVPNVPLSCGEGCESNISNALWSLDGTKIAFIDKAYKEVDKCIYEPDLIVIDTATRKKNVRKISDSEFVFKYINHDYYSECADPDSYTFNDGVGIASWLPDNVNFLLYSSICDGGCEYKYFDFNVETGRTGSWFNLDSVTFPDIRVSPNGRYITYSEWVDQPSACYGRGYQDLWSMSSLLNLAADLRVVKNKSAIILKGIAADLNFENYQLEYADIKSPHVWSLVQPPSDVPVINDVFTTWVPPYEGTFYVRLTVWDKAGNTAVSKKRVSWGQYSSITNLYKSREIFSPNNNIIKEVNNTVELHYRALEPVHLEFTVYDAENSLVKTDYKDHAGPTEDFMQWDGTDQSHNTVPDGKYKIKVFDYEFFVEVDSTPPDVKINFSGIMQDIFNGDTAYYRNLQGHAVDKNIKSWVVECGEGNNPQEWTELIKGGSQLVGIDNNGNPILNPIQDVSITGVAASWTANKKLRLTVEDYAGNKSSMTTGTIPEEIMIYSWEDVDAGSQPNIIVACGDTIDIFYNLFKGADIVETIKNEIVNLTLQHEQDGVWHDIEVFSYPLPEYKHLFSNSQIDFNKPYLIRVKATDVLGAEYYSNSTTLDLKGMTWGDKITHECPVKLRLDVAYDEAACNSLSRNATLSTEYGVNGNVMLQFDSLNYYIQKPEGLQLLRQYELRNEKWGDNKIDTAELPEGTYPVKALLNYSYPEHPTMVRSVSADSTLTVKRVLPAAQITYPTQSTTLCPVKAIDASGDWYGIHVEGKATDNSQVRQYALYYGLGDNPGIWVSALTKKDGKSLPIQGAGSIEGEIGVWDVTNVKHGTVSLKLEVVNVVGNKSCYTTILSIKPQLEIPSLAIDKKLFSPNNDGVSDDVTANVEIDEYATVDVKAFKLLTSSSGYVLDASPIRILRSGTQHLGGTGSVLWDGKDDAGVVVQDGLYGVNVFATDQCGNYTAQKWVAVEVDNTKPSAVIAYPMPGDALGNIVEVKGTADDLHFQNTILEAGQGDSPAVWTTVATTNTATKDNILGKWNTFGLDGKWTLRLTATDTVANENSTSVTIDLGLRKTLIKDLDDAPKLFSPNSDGKLDATVIKYELTDACQVEINILDPIGNIKKTYSTSTPSLGSYTHTWDGKDSAGFVVLDGAYTAKLIATLASNSSVTQSETITIIVDTTAPSVDIEQPLNNSFITATDVSVSGTISDPNLAGYSINLTGADGTTLLDQANQSRTEYTFGQLNTLPEGEYILAVNSADLGQNENNKAIVFTIDRTPPAVKLDTPKNGEYYGTVVSAASGTAIISQPTASITITGSMVEKNLDVFKLRYGLGDDPTQWTDLVTGNTVTALPQLFAWSIGQSAGIPDGLYTLSLFARDKAGLTGEAKVKVTIDNTPPTVAITAPSEDGYVKSAFEIKGTAVDQNLDKYTLEISEGQCASAFKWAVLKTAYASVQDGVIANWQALPPDGNYCLRVTAVDKIGSSAEAKVNVKVDTHPPAAPVLSGKVDTKTNAQLDWTNNTEPDLAGYNVYKAGQKINTSLVAGCELRDQDLIEGTYTYVVKAQDFAGNESIASNEVKVKIDLTGPDARIRGPRDGALVSGLIDIKGTAYSSDDFKQYRLYIGQGETPSTWNTIRTSPLPTSYGVLAQWDTLGLGEGQVYAIKLEAEDISGNITAHRISVVIDNTPPAAPLLISVGAVASDVTVTWQANTEADLAGYLLYRNEQLANVTGIVIGDMKPYLIPGTIYGDTSLPDGTFRYYLNAMDQAGNISDQSNTIEVTIETHPPQAMIVDPVDISTFGGKIMVRAESPDLDIASVWFQYQSVLSSPTITTDWLNLGSSITSATLATYLDPSALGLVYGDYRLRALATDKGNKTDPTPGFITITYTDLTAPAASIGLSALVSGNTVTLAWTAGTEVDLAGYNLYRNGLKVNAELVAGSELREENLADGTYLYTVTAVDTHRNESETSNPASARVYAPVIVQPYTPMGQSTIQVQGSNAAVNSPVEISVTTVGGYELRVETQADSEGKFMADAVLGMGENTISARATDSAGNMSRDAVSIVVVHNDTPGAPTGLAAAAQNSDVHLTWNANPETDLFGYNVYRDGVKVNQSDSVVISQATLTASSSYDPQQYDPARAMDSSLDSYWMPQEGMNAANPAWWEMDLASLDLVSHVEMHWGSDVDISGNEVLYAGKDFEVQVWSTDAKAWITQVKATGNSANDNVFDFKPSYRTDKIRIVITDSTDVNSAKQVRLSEISVIKDNIVSTSAQPAYDDLNLLNKQYAYTVTAVDNYGFESQPSSAATTTVAITPPDQPANLSVTQEADGGLHASWTYSGNPAAGYYLYRSTTSGGPYTKGANSLITDNSYLDTGLTSGATYYYVITAVDLVGNEGVYSNEASGSSLDAVAPSKPVILMPTVAGVPIVFQEGSASIAGSAEPGVDVDLFSGGNYVASETASDLDASTSAALTTYDGSWPSLSPDGESLVYEYNGSVWLKTISTGSVTQIIAQGDYPLWSPDGSRIAYIYDEGYSRQVGIYDVATGVASSLTDPANSYAYAPSSWSADGRKLAFTTWSVSANSVWVADVTTGGLTLVMSNPDVSDHKLSLDGTMLVYFENQNLLIRDLATGEDVLIDDNTDGYSVDWSPDGRHLAFVSYRNGSGDVCILSMESGDQTIISGSSGDPYYLAWTADGQNVLFDLWDEANDHDTLWLADVLGRTQTRRIIPELKYVYFVGASRSGDIAIVEQTSEGDYRVHMMQPAGRFEFTSVQLSAGENIFTAVSSDAAGNSSAASDAVSVTYDVSTSPDLAVSADYVYLYPPYPIAGEQMAVNAVVWNPGQTDISNVDVAVYVWNALNQLELLKSETIPALAAGSSALVTATWNSTGKIGDNRLVVVVDPDNKIAELDETNNLAIRDFYVADRVGVSMSTALDAVQYNSSRNANIAVTIRNSGPAKDAVLQVRIEDENGYLVSSFDPRSVALAYASTASRNFAWNTGSTYAGPYVVHAVLQDSAGTTLAENMTSFDVLSDAAADLTVVTDKAAYGPQENVVSSFTIKNTGTNSIIPLLQATVSITDASGAVLFSGVKTASNLLPGSSADLILSWNTGLTTPGNYFATVAVSSDGAQTMTKAAAFTINSSLVLTGTITVSPSVVAGGNTAQVLYTVANSGNADAPGLTVRIAILDPESQTVMQVSDETMDIPANTGRSGQATVNTTGYGLKTYKVVLQTLSQGVAKNIANATFTVKDLTSPALTISLPMANGSYGAAVFISVLASDDASGVDRVEYQVDNNGWKLLPVADPSQGRYAATWDTAPADNGSHTLFFKAVDKAGNATMPVPIEITIQNQVDVTPPTGSISINNGATYTNDPVVMLTLGCTDTESGCAGMQISNDNAAWSASEAYAASKAWTLSTGDGPKTVYVKYTDGAGNPSGVISASITLDTTTPSLMLSALANGALTNSDTLNIAGTVLDNIALQGVTINDTAITVNADGTFSQALTLATGSNIISTVATDLAGNKTADTRTITLDQTAPVVTISHPSDNSKTNEITTTVTGTVDKLSLISIRVNGALQAPDIASAMTFTFPITYAYCQNHIEVTAIDLAGNPGTAKRTVTFDNISPSLSVTNPSQDITTNQASILLQGSVADLTITSVTVTFDGAIYESAVTDGTFQQPLTFMTEKTYAISVTATDEVGNASTVQRNIIYDKTPPALSIDPVQTPTNTSQQVVTGTMELNSTVTITCLSATAGLVSFPTDTTWSVIIADMTEGTNLITVSAADQIGNVSNPARVAIVLDIHAPVTTASPAAGTYNTAISATLIANEAAKIYFTTDGTAPTTASPIYGSPIAIAASTTLKYFAVDEAGNSEMVKSATYVINTGPPSYGFYGFFNPVDNSPSLNTANAGQAIPIKWRLTDANRAPVSDPASFKSLISYIVNCASFSGDPVDAIEEYASGSSGLLYVGDGNWHFNWKTSKAYAKQCRMMVLTLGDNSTHTAQFKFK